MSRVLTLAPRPMMSKQPAPMNTVNAEGAGNGIPRGILNLLLPLLTGGQQNQLSLTVNNAPGVISSQSNLWYLGNFIFSFQSLLQDFVNFL